MELRDYVRILRRNWIILTCTLLLGLLVAGGVSLSLKPTYTAQTQLFVSIQSAGSITELQQGNTFSQARVQSYVETAKTPAVLQPVIDSLGLRQTPEELAKDVVASADINTVLITIKASNVSPVQAASVAEAVGESLIKTINSLETPSQGGLSPVKISVVTPATAPIAPTSPNIRLNLLVGVAFGLISGIIAAIARSTLDTRIRGEVDLRTVTDAPILGAISFDPDATKKPLLTQAVPQSPRPESFRQIRTNLQFSHVSNESKTVLITSSLPGEGKSTTATNLAIAMAQAGQSVVLIDADLRRPRVNEYLGLERNAGLTTALIGETDVNDLLQPWGDDQLWVLTSGRIPPNPSELLGSQSMRDLISRLESTFDAVIIDAPPLLPVTDAVVLSQQVGGVVLVIGSSKVKSKDLQNSLNALNLVEADVLGVVLNHMPSKGMDSYNYSYYSTLEKVK